jgi:glycosyltransferase involved in cell wall biosynthesis
MVNVAERLRAAGCTWPIMNVGPVDLSGYGPAAGDLLKRAEQADVRNLGLQSQETAWWYVAHASVGYMPLINIDNNVRGMPNKLFENLLFGLPMVGMNVGNIAATINETGAGLLVAPEDAQGHADALLRLVNDDPLRERLAANARAASSHYSFDGELQRLIALYERIDSRVQPVR